MRLGATSGKHYWLSIALLGLLVATSASHEWPRTNHQVFGVLFGAGVILHVIWNRRWLSATARRFIGQLYARTRFTFVVNLVGLLTTLGAVLSGLAISSWAPWRRSHALAEAHESMVTIFFIVTLIHLGLHAGYLWRQTINRLANRGRNAAAD